MNQDIAQKLHEDRACIAEHPIFSTVQDMDPAMIDSSKREYSSHQAAYCANACAMALTCKYKSGGHLVWFNQLWLALPCVRMNPMAI